MPTHPGSSLGLRVAWTRPGRANHSAALATPRRVRSTAAGRRAPSIALFCFVVLLSRSSFAWNPTFAPVACSATNWTNVPFSFNVGGANASSGYDPNWEAPAARWPTMHPSEYDSSLSFSTSIAANQYVANMGFEVTHFGTVPGHDSLSYGSGPAWSNVDGTPACNFFDSQANGGFGTGKLILPPYANAVSPGLFGQSSVPFFLSGDIPNSALPIWYETCTPVPPGGGDPSLQGNPMTLSFNSQIPFSGSSYIHDTGISIDQLRVACYAALPHGAPLAFAPLRPGFKASGVLLGANDTVYFTMPGPSGNDVHTTFTIWPNSPTNNSDEYGMYVSCNAAPTATSWQWGVSDAVPGPDNFMEIPANQCTNGTYYIAINDISNNTHGPTVFNIVGAMHKNYWHRNLSVGYDFANATAQDLSDMKDAAVRGAKAWFGASMGTVYIEQIDFYDNQSSNECSIGPFQLLDVCMKHCNDSYALLSRVWNSCDTDTWGSSYGPYQRTPKTLAHELSHAKFGSNLFGVPNIHDEYYGGACFTPTGMPGKGICDQCTHSIMDHQRPWDLNAYCTEFDHGQENDAPLTVHVNCGNLPAGGSCRSVWNHLGNDMPPEMIPTTGNASNVNYMPINFHSDVRVGAGRFAAIVDHH
jgi:hypothetical protein